LSLIRIDACAEAWVDPIGDPDHVAEIPGEEEPAQYQVGATSTLRESAEANLETVGNGFQFKKFMSV